MRIYTTLSSIFLLLFCLLACQKEVSTVSVHSGNSSDDILSRVNVTDLFTSDYRAQVKPYLMDIGLATPQIENPKAQLGRLLFYDKNLSSDRTVSCASCHKQEFAFADNRALTPGVENRPATRNSMALGNVASFGGHYSPIHGVAPRLLWDGRAGNVAEQAPLAFSHPHEMDMSMEALEARVASLSYYCNVVEKVYGDKEVTPARIMESIQHFVNAIGSSNSKLDIALNKIRDQVVNDNVNATTTTVDSVILAHYGPSTTVTITTVIPLFNFTPSELRGRTLFAQNCTKCHSPVRPFQEVFMACNGLETEYADQGLANHSGKAEDRGVFKATSLRNVALSAPYMHDGRFQTLEEVVEFYNSGIQPHKQLAFQLREGWNGGGVFEGDGGSNGDVQPLRMNLSAGEKQALIAFLKTLTDDSVIRDQKFSDPFVFQE